MINATVKKVSNNLTVVMDYIPHVQSATLGLWSGIGSKVEDNSTNGICHFLEHMVFKGTKTRTTLDIANHIESQGGYLNAYTSKEKTAWYARVLPQNIPTALDVIFDIICNSTFLPKELEKERGVILEEIKMYLDSPSDIAYNLFDSLAFKNSTYAMPIIGSKQTVSSFSSQDFINHCAKYYYPSNMVLAISGNFNQQQFLELANKYANLWQDKPATLPQVNATYTNGSTVFVKDLLEQANLIYGFKGRAYTDDNYATLKVLNNILGSGMTSKLWLKIREEHGLAYSVDSYLNSFSNVGAFCVAVGCDANNVNLVIDLINKELKNPNITTQDLAKAKVQLKAFLAMGLESTFNRCNKIATNLLDFGKIQTVEESNAKIDAVTMDDIVAELETMLQSKPTLAVVSPKPINIAV